MASLQIKQGKDICGESQTRHGRIVVLSLVLFGLCRPQSLPDTLHENASHG